MKKHLLRKIIIALLAVFVLIQFFGTKKNTSTVVAENAIEQHYAVPPSVQSILHKSCYDCHSNNTKYPWYNNIQPVQWWLAHHIKEGKEELNFDAFYAYPAKKKLKKLDKIVKEIRDGDMPLTTYTLIHRNAVLTASEKAEIENWVAQVKKEIQ